MNILEAYSCTNITCTDNVNRILVVRMHLEQTAHALLLARADIEGVRTRLNLTGIHTEESQTAHVWVCGNLKHQSSCLLVLAGLTVFLFTGLGVSTHDIGSIQG